MAPPELPRRHMMAAEPGPHRTASDRAGIAEPEVTVSATRRDRAANALLASVAAMVLAGCASAGQSSGSIVPSGTVAGAGDSCTAASPPAYLDRARTVFIGTALPGPTADSRRGQRRRGPRLSSALPRPVVPEGQRPSRGDRADRAYHPRERGCRGRGRHRAASRAALENLHGLAAHALPDLSLRRFMRDRRSGR